MALNISKELEEQARREEGLWVDVGSGASVLMSDPRSNAFQKSLQREETQYRKRNGIRKGKDLTTDERADVMWRAMFKNVVREWKGFVTEDDKGGKEKPLEFTLENFLFLMNDVWRVREAVMAFAADDETFDDAEDREELAKNSG